jgi:hypothetical protein
LTTQRTKGIGREEEMLRISRVHAAPGIFLFGDPLSLPPIHSPLTYFPERTLDISVTAKIKRQTLEFPRDAFVKVIFAEMTLRGLVQRCGS